MMSIAVGVAKGMNFLHALGPTAPLIQLSSKHVMVCNTYNFSIISKNLVFKKI